MPCAAGYYGNETGRTWGTCSGLCPAGYMCPSGAVNATALPCPPGQYSTAGAATCTLCPAGRYGNASAATSSSCSGPCNAGQFGLSNQTDPSCSGPCTAGYYCPAGTTSSPTPSQYSCAPGQYSSAGAGACSPCAPGRFGNTSHLTTSNCTDVCAPGYVCPSGSANATAVPCPAGYYSSADHTACVPCAAGYYGAAAGLNVSTCSGPCASGRFALVGDVVTSPNCSGLCPAGYRCAPGSTNATMVACGTGQYSTGGAGSLCTLCDAGRYGGVTGLTASNCSGPCQTGSYGSAGTIRVTPACDGFCVRPIRDVTRGGACRVRQRECEVEQGSAEELALLYLRRRVSYCTPAQCVLCSLAIDGSGLGDGPAWLL